MHCPTRGFASRRSSIVLAATLASFSAAPLFAADGTWQTPVGGSWEDTNNWQGGSIADGVGAIAAFDAVDFNGSVPVTLGAPHTVGTLRFGDTDPTTASTWLFTGSTLTLAGTSPTINISGLNPATRARFDNVLTGNQGLTITGGGTVAFYAVNTYTGGTRITGGSTLVLSTTGNLAASIVGTAGLNDAANVITLDNGTLANEVASGNPTSSISNAIAVANGSTGTVRMSNRVELRGAVTGDAASTLNLVVGSTAFRNDLRNSFTGFSGTLNITSAVANTQRQLRLLVNNAAPTFNTNSWVNSTVNVDNVTIRTRASSAGNTIVIGALGSTGSTGILGGTDGTGGNITYQVGAKNIDTTYGGLIENTNTTTFLTKVGTGKLSLTNAHTYTGTTAISAGTLAISGGGNINSSATVSIASGATFDVLGASSTYSTAANQTVTGTGTVVGNFDHDEGTLNPGGALAAGTLTFANNLGLIGGTLNFDVSANTAPGGTNDLINVGGTANFGGNLTLNIAGSAVAGSYTLVSATGGTSGNTTGWTITGGGRGTSFALNQTSNALLLNVTPGTPLNLTWVGNNGSAWDVNSTVNFVNGTSPTTYFQGDNVRFDDTAVNGTVNYAASLTPGHIVVDNSSLSYAFTGTGAINGSADLVKRGTNTLTISTANGYTGGTRIEAGTIDMGTTGAALGTGTITLAGGRLQNGGVNFSNAIVADTGTTSELTVVAPTGTATLSLGGAISGAGTLSIVSTGENRLIDIGSGTALTGQLNISPTGNAVTVRHNGAGFPTAAVTIGSGSTFADRSTTGNAVALGSLSGTAGSTLRGYQGGGSIAAKTYEIGALNTSTTFDGNIINGAGSASSVSVTNITKVGTGRLNLNGANTYTGTTTVKAGTLALGLAAHAPVLGSDTITAPAGADIQGGKLVLAYTGGTSPAAQVRTILAAGYAEATKFSTGQIRSTTLQPSRTLGYVDNTTTSEVTIAYTVPGDADLNLTVGFSDLVSLAQNYNQNDRVWSQGDFNYDSTVGFADLVLLAQNYNGSASLSASEVSVVGASFAADFALAQSLVPEPTTLGVLGGLATMVLRRRRA